MDSERIDFKSGWYLTRLYHDEWKTIHIPKEGPLSIGRSAEAHVSFASPTFKHISREHCILQMIDGQPTMIDCFSNGGTFVNKEHRSKFDPGQIVLKEGDIVGIGQTNDDILHYYQTHRHILQYRVCREIGDDETITISDDENDCVDQKTRDDEKNMIVLEPARRLPSVAPSCCVYIPREQIEKSDFEKEYDMYVDRASEPCMSDSDESSQLNDIIVIDDDEYTDQHYSQILLETLKQESVDAEEEVVILDEPDEVVNLGWASKLNSDADATNRYKPREKKETNRSAPGSIDKQKTATVKESNKPSKDTTDLEKQHPIASKKDTTEYGRTIEEHGKSSNDVDEVPSSSLIKKRRKSVAYRDEFETNRSDLKSKKSRFEGEDTSSRTTSEETVEQLPQEKKNQSACPKLTLKRRNSVADWNVLGAHRPGGAIEIAPPEKRDTLSKFPANSRDSDTGVGVGVVHNSSPSVKTSQAKCSKATTKKPDLSFSIAELQAKTQKKLKRRYSVSDKSIFDTKAPVKNTEYKEQRNNRLKELSHKHKHEKSVPPSTESTAEQNKKSTFTKPKVKFTSNNRGMFLTAPIPPPKPKPASLPTPNTDSIVCTQSTSLDQLPGCDFEQVVDMRPKKLTFQSVSRVSNVDRPVPKVSEPKKLTIRRNSAVPPSSTISSSVGIIPERAEQRKKPTDSAPENTVPKPVTKTKGILKPIVPLGDAVKVKKKVTFVEAWNEVRIYERESNYITETPTSKTIQEEVKNHEIDLISEILEWRTEWLLPGGSKQTGASNNGPFASVGRMLQSVENYADYASFKEINMPFIKRELWNDLITNSDTSASYGIRDISIQNTPHRRLCQIVCKVYSKTNNRELYSTSNFGILEYTSKQNERCSLFVFVRNYSRVPEQFNMANNAGSSASQTFLYIFYAAARELEELRPGRHHMFRPITRIHMHMGRSTALAMLQYSPLLPNILSPSDNIKKISTIEKTPAPTESEDYLCRLKTLNEVQLNVVRSVVNECSAWDQPTISLLQGPPGTGKSLVISHIVLELMHIIPKPINRMKVLVCASSNTAVDVIVKNLLSLAQQNGKDDLKLIRTGTEAKIDPECKQVYIDKLVQDEIARVNRLTTVNENTPLMSTYQREKKMLDHRIRMAREEHSKGNNAIIEKIEEMIKRRQRLEELINPGSSPGVRKNHEIEARRRLINEANILCTTLGSLGTLASYGDNLQFSVCVIDEATQCTELCTLLPLQYNLSKLLLVGDINQLPATVLDKQSIQAGFKMSLFSRIYASYHDSKKVDELKMLTTQYRMHPEIAQWPNVYFYDGKLKNAPSTQGKRKTIPLKPYMVVSMNYDQELTQGQYEIYNKDEILFVVGLMKEIVQCCQKETSFAIITPYARHKEELLTSLSINKLSMVEVHSIDSVQGKEYDVVIISLARSNGAGFLNNPERINVAMTRARQCLVLCGNFTSLRHKPVWSSLLDDAESRKKFYHLEDYNEHETDQHLVKNIMQNLRQ